MRRYSTADGGVGRGHMPGGGRLVGRGGRDWPSLPAYCVHAMLAALLLLALPAPAAAACRELAEPWPAWSTTGVVGCTVYGDGQASTWGGPGVARNDCEWPWTDCAPIRVTSLLTGRSVVVTPTMWCDCWLGLGPGETGPAGERPRLVDLGPGARAALGLGVGLHDVRVEPVGADGAEQYLGEAGTSSLLPNTASR